MPCEVGPCHHYTMFFIIISAVHVSGGFSAHHRELIKLCAALGIVMLSCCQPMVPTHPFEMVLPEDQ